MKPCPYCGAMLAAALADAGSCPKRPALERRVDARIPGAGPGIDPAEVAARRLVAYALLGTVSNARAHVKATWPDGTTASFVAPLPSDFVQVTV